MAGMGVHSKMNKGIHQNTQVVGCELHIQRHPARLCKPGGRWQDLGLGLVVDTNWKVHRVMMFLGVLVRRTRRAFFGPMLTSSI